MLVEGLLDLFKAGVLKRAVDGAVAHAGFFVGSRAFYAALREMPDETRAKFAMTAISFVNQLYGDEARKRAARTGARFINDAMMATALGDIVSDGLDDGRIVSGVGGQYNFVAQAFALDDARAIIMLRATRTARGEVQSNIRWRYAHATIPRHLRDIVITEYGIADLRGKSDRDVIAAMLAVTDARFQDDVLREASDAGKIEKTYALPKTARDNTPDALARALKPAQDSGLLPAFPFGSDFTDVEQRLLPALQILKSASLRDRARVLVRGLGAGGGKAELDRLGLARPRTLAERLYAALVRGALAVGPAD
jgi:acyl-CoA hydrolase